MIVSWISANKNWFLTAAMIAVAIFVFAFVYGGIETAVAAVGLWVGGLTLAKGAKKNDENRADAAENAESSEESISSVLTEVDKVMDEAEKEQEEMFSEIENATTEELKHMADEAWGD